MKTGSCFLFLVFPTGRIPSGQRIGHTRRHLKKSALAELRRTASALEAVLKSSEWRFPLIFQGFSGYSTKIAPPFNHKNG
ncbi:MAG: hypothetical protein KHX46_07670, partial [Clostridiales bacterium]|nr:hypothetical protein [Clostridiales bacterium]